MKKITDAGEVREIKPDHYVYCKEKEVQALQEERAGKSTVQTRL